MEKTQDTARASVIGPGQRLPREFGSYRVSKRTRKTVTLFSPGAASAGARFVGKRYQYRFDGVGFVRAGRYLRCDGSISALGSDEQ